MGRAVIVGAALLVLFAGSAQAQEDFPPPAPPPLGDPGPAPAPLPPPPQPQQSPTYTRPAPATAPAASDASPVVRAEAGNLALLFSFGGLATLAHDSHRDHNVGPLLFQQVGMKIVLSERFMIPLWFGTGFRLRDTENADAQAHWGIEIGGGFEYHFRIWRRISPFFGFGVAIEVEDQSGSDNSIVGFELLPRIGVEYYIADRVSLTASYLFRVDVLWQDNPVDATTSFGLATRAGGLLSIAYYF